MLNTHPEMRETINEKHVSDLYFEFKFELLDVSYAKIEGGRI